MLRGLRHLLQGRVTLKAAANIGDESIQLGVLEAERFGGVGSPIMGNRLWKNKSADARIVQPALVGNPPGEGHFEEIVWDDYQGFDMESTTPGIVGALTNSYTITGKHPAYVRLRDAQLPGYMKGDHPLKIAAENVIERWTANPERFNIIDMTPGLLVRLTRRAPDTVINREDEQYYFDVFHWWQWSDFDDPTAEFCDRLDDMYNMVNEDWTLGGTAEYLELTAAGELEEAEQTRWRQSGMDIFHITLMAKRRETYKDVAV